MLLVCSAEKPGSGEILRPAVAAFGSISPRDSLHGCIAGWLYDCMTRVNRFRGQYRWAMEAGAPAAQKTKFQVGRPDPIILLMAPELEP